MLVENREDSPQGSDIQGLSADLLEAARRRNLSANSLAAYERTWTRFLAWAAASNFDPRSLPFPAALEAYRFLGEGKNAASLRRPHVGPALPMIPRGSRALRCERPRSSRRNS